MDRTTDPPRRQARGVSVWHAENLDVGALVESYGQRISEGVLCLGHCVLTGLATDARWREAGQVPLKAEYLRAVIGRHHLDAVRDAAERIGYVGRDRSYRAGSRSQRYGIPEPYATARPVRVELTDRALCQNMRRWKEAREREAWRRIHANQTPISPEVCEHLRAQLDRIRIDQDIDFGGDGQPAHLIAADAMRRREFWFVVDEFGRLHTNITSLPRFLRAYLTVDGKRLVGVDIGESQPLFIGLALAAASRREEEGRKGGRNGHHHHGWPPSLMMDTTMMDETASAGLQFERSRLPGDLRGYLELCEQRGLYRAVAEELGISRDEAKPKVMQVFFGRPWHRTPASEALEKRFPGVLRDMRAFKRGDHRRLAHLAQRVESAFMYGRVVPRIMRQRPGLFVATIHDSILTTEGDEQTVRGVVLEEFARLGVQPRVKVEL